jgi:phosphoglycolate phosphatase-like HAD superfamily hydrolase
MPLKAIVYDLDGTLVDSRGDLSDSVNATLEALGLPQGLGMLGSFQAVIGGDEAPRKPEAEGLLALCRARGSAPPERSSLATRPWTSRQAAPPECASAP